MYHVIVQIGKECKQITTNPLDIGAARQVRDNYVGDHTPIVVNDIDVKEAIKKGNDRSCYEKQG